MRIHNRLATLLLCALPLSVSGLDDDLEPPDVDFFAELQATRTDARDLGGGHSDGARISLGTWLNELAAGPFEFGLDSSFNWMGESESRRSFVQENVPISPDETIDMDVDERTDIDLNGLAIGGRVLFGNAILLRGGSLYYSMRARTRQHRIPVDEGSEIAAHTITDTERESGLAPYLGAGFQLPLGNTRIHFTADYSVYWVESERIDGGTIGVSYRM